MKTINKTTLALAFSVLGAVSSMSAIAMSTESSKEHRIELIADGNKDIQVFINAQGDISEFELSPDTLKDPVALESALTNVPVEIRDKLVEQLQRIDIGANVIHIENSHEDISTWTDGESEQIFVFNIDDASNSNIAKKLVKKIKHDGEHKVINIERSGQVGADLIMKLLEKGTFTVDDLDSIQQALDAKR